MKRLFEMVGGMLSKKTHTQHMEAGAKDMASRDLAEAEKHYGKALEMAEELKDHEAVARCALQLAVINEENDKLAVAETYYRKAYSTFEENEEFEEAAKGLLLMGRLYYKQKRVPDAEQVLQYAMAIYQQQFGAYYYGIAEAANCLADVAMFRNNYSEAEKLLVRAISIDETQKGWEDPIVAAELHKLALCFEKQDKPKEAVESYKKSVKIYDKHASSFDKKTAHAACACFHNFGLLLKKQGQDAEAKATLAKATKLAEDYPGYLEEAELIEASK